MHHVYGTRRTLLLVCLFLATGQGCAAVNTWRWPWEEKEVVDPALYAKTATARIEAIQALSSGLASKSADEQQRIVTDLSQRIQNESDPQVRREIIRAVAHTKVDMAAAILNAGLQDSSPAVREACCVAWGHRGGPEAARLLGGALSSDTNLDVRLAAAKALGNVKDPGTTAALAVALEDKNPAIQYRVVQSLRATAPVDVGDDVSAWRRYAKTGQPPAAKDTSVAERLRQIF